MPNGFSQNIDAYLQAGNDHSRMFKIYETIITNSKIFNENIVVLLLKRFLDLFEPVVEWWSKAPEGDVYSTKSLSTPSSAYVIRPTDQSNNEYKGKKRRFIKVLFL